MKSSMILTKLHEFVVGLEMISDAPNIYSPVHLCVRTKIVGRSEGEKKMITFPPKNGSAILTFGWEES